MQLNVEHPDGVGVLVHRLGGRVTPVPPGSLRGMLPRRPLPAVEVLGALGRWSKGRTTLSGGDPGWGCMSGLGSAGRCGAQGQAGPSSQTKGRTAPPPPRAKPKPAVLPFTPMCGSPATSRTPPSRGPRRRKLSPPPQPPRPKRTHAAKPAPIPPRGKHPYAKSPMEGKLIGCRGGGRMRSGV